VLFDIQPLLGLNLLGEVVGVAIMLFGHRTAIAGAGWPVASSRLHARHRCSSRSPHSDCSGI
jgi:hypothetical protein